MLSSNLVPKSCSLDVVVVEDGYWIGNLQVTDDKTVTVGFMIYMTQKTYDFIKSKQN